MSTHHLYLPHLLAFSYFRPITHRPKVKRDRAGQVQTLLKLIKTAF